MERDNRTNTEVVTAWVAPPASAGGQDHLAIRAVGEAMYAELVPGITNVTERIRCYGFYTWFTWWFAKRAEDTSLESFKVLFRRAECLHALVGAQHGMDETGSDAHPDHGAGLPGRDTLLEPLRTLEGRELRLSSFAAPELKPPIRYFAPDLGGLRQYYLGSLQQLDVMGRGSARGELIVSEGRGQRLAEAFDSSVPGELFWNTVVNDVVSVARLQELTAFCPCRLRQNDNEREVLLDLLLRRDGHKSAPSIADTLVLVMEYLAATRPFSEAREIVSGFRKGVYAGVLPDGTAWRHTSLETWAGYQRHELLSIALQSLFSIVLEEIRTAPLPLGIHAVADVASWFVERSGAALPEAWRSMKARTWFSKSAENLPPLGDIGVEAHELTIADAVLLEKEPAARIVLILELLAKLTGRMGPMATPYGAFKRETQFFRHYSLNLHALRRYAEDVWPDMTLLEWLEWLVAKWSLGVHLRVALRKLRDEHVDTFRVKPTDVGLVFVDQASPSWSNPRLVQVLRALRDLGLVNESYQLLPAGRVLLGELHGQ